MKIDLINLEVYVGFNGMNQKIKRCQACRVSKMI